MAVDHLRTTGGSGAFRRLEARPLKRRSRKPSGRGIANLLLLAAELAAVVGVVWLLSGAFRQWRAAAEPQPLPQTMSADHLASAESVTVLPGQHQAPSSGAIPEHLRNLVKPLPPMVIAAAAPGRPSRIVIEKLSVDSPVVEGDDEESLKMGVGHHIGSAGPGTAGNMVLSGHNDVYGETFRYLDRLSAGDRVVVYSGVESFEYIVRDKRIVEPNDVSVLQGTEAATLTLVSCYPYLVDTHRIVVIAELAR